MSISVGTSFSLNNKEQNFVRDSFKTITEMKNFPETSLPPIFHAMNEEDGNLYIYNVNNVVDTVTGKWKKIEGGNQGVDLTQIQPLLDNKVDKVDGKGLSENDLTTVKQTRYEEAYNEKHQHDNSMVLAGLTDVDGSLKYNGADIVGTSALTVEQAQILTDSQTHIGNISNPHTTKIDNLADVQVGTKINGQVLAWSDQEQKYVLGTYGIEVGANGTWIINGTDTGIPTTDTTGRVRLTPTSPQLYLQDVLDKSLTVDNDKLMVVGINGLKTPIAQLNLIQGLDKNIMEYLALLSGSMKFKGVLENDDALNAVVGATAGDTYIVKQSATNEDKTITFTHDGVEFKAVGETNMELRDFTAEPLNLATETTGVLPKEKVEGHHEHTNLNDVLEQLSVAGDELLFKGKSLKGEQGEAGQDAESNYNALTNKPSVNNVTLVGNKTFKQLGGYTEMLSKEEFESEINKGNVKISDDAINIEAFTNQNIRNQPYMYYGTNMKNEIGKHVLPINANDNSAIQQRIFENVVAGDSLSFDSITDINNKALINVYTEIQGRQDITETIKEFNINTQQSFECSKEILFNETNCGLTGSKTIKPTYNNVDEVYEYDLSDFTIITSCTELI